MSSLEQAAESFSKASQTQEEMVVRQVEESVRTVEPLIGTQKSLLPQKIDVDIGKLMPSYTELLDFLKAELEKDPKKVAEDLLALIKPASCLPALFSWFTRK